MTQDFDKELAEAIDIAIRCGAIAPEQKDARHFEITRTELWRLVQAARRAPVAREQSQRRDDLGPSGRLLRALLMGGKG